MTEFAHPIITELLPKPSTGNEWIEIHNPTATRIDLMGWTLTDQLSQPSLIYTFATTPMDPGDTLVVEVNKKLNDSGDGVNLVDANGQVIDTTSYTNAAPTDLSWARLNIATDSFDWTNPSPGLSPSVTSMPVPNPTSLPTTAPTPTTILVTTTPRPISRPSQSPSPTSIQITHNLGPTTSSALKDRLTIAAKTDDSSLTNQIRSWPTPYISQATSSSRSNTSVSVAESPKTNVLDMHSSRQVYFPDWRSPAAIHNVIIGGLILAVYNGFLIWFDWQQSQLIEL